MKAIIWSTYGPPNGLIMGDIEKPIPKKNEILVKVHAAAVSTGDSEMRQMKLPMGLGIPLRIFNGIIKPTRIKVLGQELSGVVESVGEDVTRFKIGDSIFAATGIMMGAYAEYICLPETSSQGVTVLSPKNLTYEEAAAVPLGGLEALHFLREAKIEEGNRILIIGAGGSIGTMGVQLAKHWGGIVTTVDHGTKEEMLLSLGSDYFFDYTLKDIANIDETFDVIFDVVGKNNLQKNIPLLRPGGSYLMANPSIGNLIHAARINRTKKYRIITQMAERSIADLEILKSMIEAEKITPIIDRILPWEKTAEAHRYVDSGLKKGAVVLKIAN